MSMHRLGLLGLSLAAALAAATALCRAADPAPKEGTPAEKEQATKNEQALADIAAAFEMADAGRRAGSPEALVGAARILSRVEGVTQLEGVKAVTAKADAKEKPKAGEPIEEKGQTVSFEKEVKALLEDARKLNVNNDPHLAALIDGVKVDGRRGTVRGPGSFSGFVASGNQNTYTFRFIGGAPARVVLTSNNGVPLQLEVYNDDGVYIGGGTNRGTSEVDWTPQYTRNFTVYVTNRGARNGSFTLFKN
jgi:hypothetical protein